MKIVNFIKEFASEGETPLEFFVAVDDSESASEFGSIVKNIKELTDDVEGNVDVIMFTGYFTSYKFDVPANYMDMSWEEKLTIICNTVAQQGNYRIDYPTVFYKSVN